jgi:hypothetical protein
MAVLPDQDRFECWQRSMELMSEIREGCTISKQDLRAAVNAIDTWVNDNAATMNAAIPQPARSALTQKQKARLFTLVVHRRYEVE